MKIMLIEDEALAMDELRHLMKPYEDKHEIVGFDNGEEALDYAYRWLPDIVVSDIRMPGMDGLEVIRRMIERHPRLQAIMLSGYNDFEYARGALKLGAKEYLLKPVPAAELYAAVDRMIEDARKEEEKSRQERNWSLSMKVRGLESGEETGITDEPSGEWLIVAILADNWNSPATWSRSGIPVSAAAQWLRSEIDSGADCFDVDAHLRIMLIPASTDRESGMRHKANRIHDYFRESVNVVHTVYRLKASRDSMKEAYERCLQLLESQVRLGQSTFMPATGRNVAVQPFWDSARRIEQHVREADYAMLQLESRRLVDALRRAEVTLKQSSVLLSDLFYALKYKMSELHGEAEAVDADSIYDFLKTCLDEASVQAWLTERLIGLMSGTEQALPNPKMIIPPLLDHIHHHYAETVRLQDFAAKYHVSIGYLSKLFKSETGDHFSDYLIRVRMNKAKELLDAGYKKITDIGKLVGYEDPKFFSQTFKRWIGVTPQQYKRND
ncbi:response regulator [Cohnella suwonensis]|uniref:Response regulator n=1 Tax=Cohnella suwonensis TaxID=696072 RepID=A0ABW0LTA1_9BACL